MKAYFSKIKLFQYYKGNYNDKVKKNFIIIVQYSTAQTINFVSLCPFFCNKFHKLAAKRDISSLNMSAEVMILQTKISLVINKWWAHSCVPVSV